LDVLLGSAMPLGVVLVLCLGAQGARGLRPALGAAPFALATGLVHTVVAALTARLLGPELPSMLGPLAALAAALGMLRWRLLLPRTTWRLPSEAAALPTQEAAPGALVAASAPYALLIGLLLLTRARGTPLAGWVHSVAIRTGPLLGTEIDAVLRPLHSPGVVFLLAAVTALLWLSGGLGALRAGFRHAGGPTLQALPALLAAVVTVRIFVHSGVNASGLSSMPLVVAEVAAEAMGRAWPLAAPWLGALGSFIAGSATFSNLLFAGVQHQVAVTVGHDPATLLALQAMGAAAGNMVCVHNVVAASAVVGLVGAEGEVMRRTFPPMAVYLLAAGALGLLVTA
jgi:lactate permease